LPGPGEFVSFRFPSHPWISGKEADDKQIQSTTTRFRRWIVTCRGPSVRLPAPIPPPPPPAGLAAGTANETLSLEISEGSLRRGRGCSRPSGWWEGWRTSTELALQRCILGFSRVRQAVADLRRRLRPECTCRGGAF